MRSLAVHPTTSAFIFAGFHFSKFDKPCLPESPLNSSLSANFLYKNFL
jgi:hypothetical protein